MDYDEIHDSIQKWCNKDEDDKEYCDFDNKKLREFKAILVSMLICMFVTNYLIYRANLVTMRPFKTIKMQNINVEGF